MAYAYLSQAEWLQWGAVICASLLAASWDLRKRRIPNWLTLGVFVGGIVTSVLVGGWVGLWSAIGASFLLASPYVVLFVFAGGGAGDAKMMGAIGMWLGLEAGLPVLFAVVVTGGVFGLANLALHRQLRPAFARIGAAFYVMGLALCSGRKGWELIKPDPDADSTKAVDERLKMPYGPAIFVGVCIAALWVRVWNG